VGYLLAVGRDLHVAVADSVAHQDALVPHLRGQPLCVWLVPDSLLQAVAAAAGLGPGAARSRAAILARLPVGWVSFERMSMCTGSSPETWSACRSLAAAANRRGDHDTCGRAEHRLLLQRWQTGGIECPSSHGLEPMCLVL